MALKEPTGPNDLLAKMKDIETRARARLKQRREQGLLPLSEADPPPPAQAVKLPLWPEAVRAVPNGVLRSALFGAIRRGPRKYLDREKVGALEGVEIEYTGQRLDQGDLDVWECVLHIARAQAMGQECRFTAYAMLKMLGKADTGGNREVLHRKLLRLRANAVEMKQGRFSYIGGLLDEVYKDNTTHEYVVVINQKLHPLFTADQFTQIDWDVRRALDGKPLAQWLHGFYASHAQPYPVSIAKLYELSGSEASELWKFAQTLRKNLDSLAKASVMHGQLFNYFIQNDVVHASKLPSRSQQLHLKKMIKKSKTNKI